MEIAFHCPNCLADLIYDESKKYTCCFCNTVMTPKDEVRELEGGYYVGDAWNDSIYHTVHCDDCGGDFIMKAAGLKQGCPMCSSTSLKDNGPVVGAMPRRAIPFAHTKQQAEEMFLDYIRNNSAVGRTLATDENKALIHKVYVPVWIFTYEVVAHARLTAMLRNKAADGKTILGYQAPEQLVELLSPIRSSISRFQSNRKGAAKDASNMPSEHITGGVLSWQGIPFDASGILPDNVMNCLQPYDQSKLVTLNEKLLADTPVMCITKDPIACMQEFMERVKKWTRQMIMDAHADSYDISYFQDRTDYPLGIGELVLFPIWYMKGEYMGRDFYFAMNGQNGEVEANIPMSKVSSKNNGITYQQYWDKARCSALRDTHFEFNIHDPSIEILDYSFFEKPKDSKVSASGKKKKELPTIPPLPDASAKTEKASVDVEVPLEAEKPEEKAAEAEKPAEKPAEKRVRKELDVEVVTDLKKMPKKLTKEEEQKRAREATARLRAAAKEAPKGDMAAAAEAPSWAKAVTPPPAASSAGARPVRKKKPALDKPSIASGSNKPLWEREDDAQDPRAKASKPSSLAEQIARASSGEVPEAPRDDIQQPQQDIPALAQQSKPIWDRTEEDELAAMDAMDNRPAIAPLAPMASFLAEHPDSGSEHEQRDTTSRPSGYYRGLHHRETPPAPKKKSLVESADDVLSAAYDGGIDYSPELPEVREIKPRVEEYGDGVEEYAPQVEEYAPQVEEEPQVQAFVPKAEEIPQQESSDDIAPEKVAQAVEEAMESYDEDMVANITFSFNKKKAKYSDDYTEEVPVNNAAIPRRTEPRKEARGMQMMNSEYDNGVLPSSAKNYEVADALEPREIVPNAPSENYIGSDANDRPLASRPLAPLAQQRDDVYVEEVDTHPELDVMNRPLAERPAAPLAQVREPMPNLDYINENGLNDDIHQMPSIVSQGKWGEMPEATETPSWAKPQGGASSDSPFASQRDRVRRPSRDELRAADLQREQRAQEEMQARQNARPAASAGRPGSRPGARPAAPAPQAQETPRDDMAGIFKRPAAQAEAPSENTRPAARPAARPGTASRPAARPAAREEAPAQKTVPLWERVPDSNGPVPAWGASAAFNDDNRRPAGSLMKPKDQIIDVEKPREKPTLWRGESDGNMLHSAASERAERAERAAGAREVVARSSDGGVREIEVRTPSAPERPTPARGSTPPPRRTGSSGNSGIQVDIMPSKPKTEEVSRPSAFGGERPRTFAQRRQMEEEQKRQEIRSSFAPVEEEAPSSPFKPLAAEPEVEREPVNPAFAPRQFEDQPSIMNSYGQYQDNYVEEEVPQPAQDESIPPLAFSDNVLRRDLAQEEEAARRAMRDLPDFDPDGPSPFK